MILRMRWFTLALVVGLVWQPGVAGTVLGTAGRKCFPSTFSISSGPTISVFGDGIENIDRAMSASGVSVTIVAKRNGVQNNRGPFAGKGEVLLRIETNNATPGDKQIGLINDPDLGSVGEKFTFTITVVASPTVTDVSVQTPAEAFQEITVTLNGTGLQEAKVSANGSIVIDATIPFITVGGNAGVSSVRVLSSSATSLQAKIFFTALVQDATLDLSFRSDNECVPLGDPLPFKKSVRVRCTNVRNYVKSISLPAGHTYDINNTGEIKIRLLFPPSTEYKGDALTNRLFFKFVPANAFAKRDGTPFSTNPEGFILAEASLREDIIPIVFKVMNCGGGPPGQTNTVRIQTWMQSTNTNLPPNFVEKTFSVLCH